MQQVFEQVAVAIELPDWLMYKTADLTYTAFGPAVDLFDGLVRQAAPSLVQYAETFTKERIHPASQKLPLMNPTYVVFGIVAYLVALVLLYPISKALGKLQLSLYAKLHNLFLFSLSFYMWAGILITAVANGFTLWNNPIGTGDGSWRMSKLLWLFYVSKLPEFNDTFIMMLKQNYRQVSFLHLYHHSTIFVIWFLVVMEGPGGDAYFSGMLNSGIHVIMYGYYFGTSVFATGPIRRFLNSIKFFITYGQMTQFSLNCVQSAYLLFFVPKPQYPVHLIKLLLVYMFTLLALFGNFLIKNQGKSAEGGGKADKKKKSA